MRWASLSGIQNKPYRVGFLVEGVHIDAKKFVRIVDLVGVFADDPDQRRFCLRLIQFLEVRAQCWDDTLIRGRISTEDVLRVTNQASAAPARPALMTHLHDNHGLLDDVGDPRGDKVQKDVDAALSRGLYLDCGLANRFDAFPDKVDIDLGSIPSAETHRLVSTKKSASEMGHALLQLAQQRVDVIVAREADHDVQFLDFDVEWVVILAEKHTHLV